MFKVSKDLAIQLASKKKWEDWCNAQIQMDINRVNKFNKNAKF
jgi:hypothetical protein